SPDYIPGPEEPEQAPSVEETEPFETDELSATPPSHPAYLVAPTAADQAPSSETDSEVARLLAISSPPASPLSPWSSPPPQIPFPPLPPILSPEAASTSHSPPLQLPSASRREDRPEVTLPPRKRLDITLGPRYEVGESSFAAAARPSRGFRADYSFVATVDREIMRDPERKVSYRITDSWDEIMETLLGAPVSTDTGLGRYVREFETRVRQDTNEIYIRLDDEQTERHLLAGRLNMEDRPEVTLPPQKRLDIALGPRYEVGESSFAAAARLAGGFRACTRIYMPIDGDIGQMSEIRELQATDRMRQIVISELLRIDHRRSIEISK
nr:hypothetical protein [Tanacetum cinerariifolium]